MSLPPEATALDSDREALLAKHELDRLLRAAPIGIYLVDDDFCIRFANAIAVAAFGGEALNGRDFRQVMSMVWHQEYADEVVQIFRQTLQSGEPYVANERAEFRVDRGQFVYYDWLVHRTPLDDGRHAVVCYFRDVSEHVEVREELRRAHVYLEERVRARTEQLTAVLKRLVSAQEEERRRIARDLHDDIGQRMTALHLQLENLRRAPREDGWELLFRDTQEALLQLDRDIRMFAGELRTCALYTLGLVPALQDLVEAYRSTYRVGVEFEAVNVAMERLGSEVEFNLFRIAQEALQNAYKHAAAQQITVLLQQRGGDIVLTISDDGCGFDDGARQSHLQNGMGLIGMRERAALIGGRLEIETFPGQGTSIIVSVPAAN